MRNILLKLEYRGGGFLGWQQQARGRTVQGVLRESLEKFLRHKVKLTGSGRTDTGVHALAQYANFQSDRDIPPKEILYRLNRILPDDIVVLSCKHVPLNFDSRRHALSRSYRYLISEKLTAIDSEFCWVAGRKFDILKLKQMAGMVAGAKHFENFCKVKSRKIDNACAILDAKWSRQGGFLRFDITANRFLHNMVRLLVGSMVAVHDGKMELDFFKKMLENKIDAKAKYIAPAQGLYLAEVNYKRS